MILSFGPVAATFVGIRLLHQRFSSVKNRLGKEDWTVLLTVPVGIATIVITKAGLTAHGMGQDIWGVKQSDLIDFGRYFFIAQFLYIVLMALIKLTLCLFYLNIFAGRIIRRLIWGTVAFHVAFSVAFVVGMMFQCTLIRYQWERFDFDDSSMTKGYCININAATWSHAVISVASDFWLLAIPSAKSRASS